MQRFKYSHCLGKSLNCKLLVVGKVYGEKQGEIYLVLVKFLLQPFASAIAKEKRICWMGL